ncbi:MAG: VOC family protein [Chloroflexi bacterium]|nr:VOC family protein [Chloroflexota bacterium]
MFKLKAVSIAVNSAEEALRTYTQSLGLPAAPLKEHPLYGYRGHRLPVGDAILDLLEPTDPNNPIGRFIQRRGEGLYLITLEVDNMEQYARDLEAKGVRVIWDVVEPGSQGPHPIVHPRSAHGVLIELAHPGRG